MTLKRWIVAGVIGATVVGTIGVSAIAFGSRSSTPDRVIVERIGNRETVRWTVTSPDQAAQLYRDTVGLPTQRLEVMVCPMIASLYTYRLTFLGGSETVLVASFDPGGCHTVMLKPGGTRGATGAAGDRFWGALAQAMGIRTDSSPMIPAP